MSDAGTTTVAPADRRRLWALAACGLLLGAAAVCFNLLYLFVPAGLSPSHGFAPDIGAAYSRWLPLPHAALGPRPFSQASFALQAAMWSAFLAAVFLVGKLRGGAAEKTAFRLVAAGAALASLALILTPPALSPDLYHYALFGRMILTRGLNPYVTPGNAISDDPLWPLAIWQNYPTHYGPVFTGLSVLAAAGGAGGAIGTALAFKTMATAFGALAAWSVVSLARQQKRSSLLPLALVVWNPLVLVETAGSGHNEMVMMGLALAGLAVAGNGRPKLGFALMVGSVHVKWVTAALLGLHTIVRLRDIDGLRARAWELAKLFAIAAGITIALYLPFWVGRDSMTATRSLMVEGRGSGGLHASNLLPFAAAVAIAIGVVVRFGRRHLLEMSALVCLGFVLFVFPWALPWYLIPAATLLSIGPLTRTNRMLLTIVIAFSILLMANWAVLIPR